MKRFGKDGTRGRGIADMAPQTSDGKPCAACLEYVQGRGNPGALILLILDEIETRKTRSS
jgi:hypothetical protein